MAVKTCSRCHEEKPLEAYNRAKKAKDGRQSWCRECEKIRAREYREANRDKERARHREYHATNLEEQRTKKREYFNTEEGYWVRRETEWRRMGIVDVDTLDWAELIEAQGSKCFVCDKIIDVYTAHRDHDHETGLTRAAVCSTKCNQAMDA